MAETGVAGTRLIPALLPKPMDLGQKIPRVRRRLHVKGDLIRPGLGKGDKKFFRAEGHQVDVEEGPAEGPQILHQLGAKGQIRHKLAVHHIQVQPGRTRRVNFPRRPGKIGKIRGKHRGGNNHRIRHGSSIGGGPPLCKGGQSLLAGIAQTGYPVYN